MDQYRCWPETSKLGATGPYEFQGNFVWTNDPFALFSKKIVWTNGAESSSKVSPEAGVGPPPWSVVPRDYLLGRRWVPKSLRNKENATSKKSIFRPPFPAREIGFKNAKTLPLGCKNARPRAKHYWSRPFDRSLREAKPGGFQTRVFPTFFGKGPDCLADPFGTVPRMCS